MTNKKRQDLRSYRWFGKDDLRSFGHRSRMLQLGLWKEEFTTKPVIGIINTWNDLNTCHGHFPQRVEAIKRGVLANGGFPVELPALSLGEQLMKPSTMLYRNLLAMEVEELLRSFPVDGAVLMGGCDKTTPGVLMGAFSMDIPSIYMPAGPMLRGNWRGQHLGSGADVWKYWDELQVGNISEKTWNEIEVGIARSHGTCMTMGTAATMMSMAEALGMSLPGASSIPAVDASHDRMAQACGVQIVDMVWQDLKPSDIVTRESFENAIIVDMAIGGSTNAIIHLTAMAKRLSIKDIGLDTFDKIARDIPLLVSVRPSGSYLMEDFYYAGGLSALMHNLMDKLHKGCKTVTGATIYDNYQQSEVHLPDVIRTLENPVQSTGGVAVLRGNLAPHGAIIKPTAAERRLLKHRGRALVFEHVKEMKEHINDDDLDVTPDTILVMKNGGPIGAPGMPEWGMLPIPKKLLQQGVRDMVRISDARMSGTSYGACILHVSPEAAVGGTLAYVKTGDIIEVDVEKRLLHLHVSNEELEVRRAKWKPPQNKYARGYASLYVRHVRQAHEGCDFDFMECEGTTPEPSIF